MTSFKATISSSILSDPYFRAAAQNNSASAKRIFVKLCIGDCAVIYPENSVLLKIA